VIKILRDCFHGKICDKYTDNYTSNNIATNHRDLNTNCSYQLVKTNLNCDNRNLTVTQ
jgi:hypothetical protein